MTVSGIGNILNYYYETAGKTAAQKEDGDSMIAAIREQLDVSEEEIEAGTRQRMYQKGKGAPYSYLADENGIIEYNGVIFVCDNQKRRLCLGDVSNPDDVIRIPLSEGGCLMVNRENIGDLSKAIGMFSPEDINRILRALKLDAKIQQMKKEIEEMEDGIGKSNAEEYADSDKAAKQAAEEKGKTYGFNGYENDKNSVADKLSGWQLDMLLNEDGDDLMAALKRRKEEILEKIRRGETEATFALGAESYTMKEWEKLLRTIDRAIEDMQKRNDEAKEEQEKEREKEWEKRENSLTVKVLS